MENTTISLYDYYASAALTGLLANTTYFNCDKKHNMIVEDEIINRASDIADRMLKKRLSQQDALTEFKKIFSQQKFKKDISAESQPETPVSAEEAASEYAETEANELYQFESLKEQQQFVKDDFIAGAKWQESQQQTAIIQQVKDVREKIEKLKINSLSQKRSGEYRIGLSHAQSELDTLIANLENK